MLPKKKKKDYCGGPKPPQMSKKPPLKVHLAYCGGGYCGGSTRQSCVAAIAILRQ